MIMTVQLILQGIFIIYIHVESFIGTFLSIELIKILLEPSKPQTSTKTEGLLSFKDVLRF